MSELRGQQSAFVVDDWNQGWVDRVRGGRYCGQDRGRGQRPFIGHRGQSGDKVQRRARQKIEHTAQLANVFWIIAVVVSVIFTGLIALVLNRSITKNILKLTRSAHELQEGGLHVRANVTTEDELGQLAQTFNAMASQIQTLISNLENQVWCIRNI